MRTISTKAGRVDGRVAAGDILEMGQPAEYLRVTGVKDAEVTLTVIGKSRGKPEAWEISELADMGARYSSRSEDSLSRCARTLTMTDAEHEAVKALLAGMRKAAK